MSIEFKSVFVHRINSKKELEARARVLVEGIGEVDFVSGLSTDLCECIEAEVVAALRVKLGQRLPNTLPFTSTQHDKMPDQNVAYKDTREAMLDAGHSEKDFG